MRVRSKNWFVRKRPRLEVEPGGTERLISGLLRWGVGVSMAVVMLGVVVTFMRHPEYVYSDADLPALTGRTGQGQFTNTLGGVWEGLKAGRGQAIVDAGLILLILTPVMRVGASVVIFLRERDRRYVGITLFVFAMLLLSFVFGKAGH